ncbi:MAG: cation transporter, partial [Acholeplasmatales bacterium]|nr:cation transporter [Acholeplasmatales bacterium]
MDEKKYTKEIAKVGIITILLNLILTISKVVAGILAKSTSLISDGIHSASDVLSTIVVIVGAKMASKKADKEHPFGHERMESVALVILAIMLFITAGTLMYNGVTSIISFFKGEYENQSGVFLYIALGFAIASIIVKGWMYFYTKAKAKQLKSETLRADAIHHLTDSISSIASVIGIIGLILGGNILILDPIMTIVISLFILKVSSDIFKDGINELIDKAAPEDFQENIHKDILNYPGVLAINDLKSRMFGS